MHEVIHISAKNLQHFMTQVLLKNGVREDVVHCFTDVLIQTSLRGVDSHGVRLFPHYLEGVKRGRINPNPSCQFTRSSGSTGLLNGDHTFGHVSAMEGAKVAVQLAREMGTGHVAIYNSSHFGAAAPYALEIAKNDMIGLSFTNTDALIQIFGGKRSFFGNNPFCMAVPCEGEEPFCLDMATSVLTFNKIRQYGEEGLELPKGVGSDQQGISTTDPKQVCMLTPIGGHKGFGLSMAIEILCSLLTGMPYGPDIPKMFEAPLEEKRYLGHFVMAIKIDCFQPAKIFKKRMSEMINRVRQESPLDGNIPIQVAGDPEKKNFLDRCKNGIPLQSIEVDAFKKISLEYGIFF